MKLEAAESLYDFCRRELAMARAEMGLIEVDPACPYATGLARGIAKGRAEACRDVLCAIRVLVPGVSSSRLIERAKNRAPRAPKGE